MTRVAYELPGKRYSHTARYTIPGTDGEKLKVIVVISEPDKFQEELKKATKLAANMEYGPKPDKLNKTIKGVRIDID